MTELAISIVIISAVFCPAFAEGRNIGYLRALAECVACLSIGMALVILAFSVFLAA